MPSPRHLLTSNAAACLIALSAGAAARAEPSTRQQPHHDLALRGAPGLDSTIAIHLGDRIPVDPEAHGETLWRSRLSTRLSADLDLVGVSLLRPGQRNNRHQADGTVYLGPGSAPGYAVVNLVAR